MRAVRIISFSALPLAVLAGGALAEELTDERMDQIAAGGLFELTADQLDNTTTVVAPLNRNVIGGVGMMVEEFLSETFSSQQSILKELGSTGEGSITGTDRQYLGEGSNTSGTISNTSGTISNTSGTISNTSGTISNTSGTISNTSGTISNTSGTISNNY